MPKHRRPGSAVPAVLRSRRLGAAALSLTVGSSLAIAFAASSVMLPADAVTTLSPTEAASPYPVVRDGSLNISVDKSAMNFTRTLATANFVQSTNATMFSASSCKGDNPGGTNNSARTTVSVAAPGGATVLTATSPVRDLSVGGFFTSPASKPLVPQPAPSNTNYRGDFSTANAYHGFSSTLDLTGKPAGVYTVTTTDQNMVKTGTGACTIGTPVTASTTTGFGTTFTPGVVVKTSKFEYRPWQYALTDVLGNGAVKFNVTPREYKFTVGSQSSPITAGNEMGAGAHIQTFFSLPGAFALPSDPNACVANLAACLPSAAVRCDPATGCTPRVMVINDPVTAADPTGLVGVFDLETKAFIAYARIGGTTRTLMSFGPANDAQYHALLSQLSTSAAAQGVDLASILATKVNVTVGNQTVGLSLLNALQIDPATTPGGIQISSSATIQAGVLLDVYANLRLSGGACVANSGSSTTTGRFTPHEASGYTVTKSDLVPDAPAVGPLAALTSGPIVHIIGKFADGALVDTASAVIGVDTAANEPNGYPVWVSPFLSGGTHVAKPKTMDFMGTGTWSASETPVSTIGCTVVDFVLGTGVAIFNNPLPIGLGTIFDPATTPNPTAQSLTNQVNAAVDSVTGQVTSNPTVSSALDTLTAQLPLG